MITYSKWLSAAPAGRTPLRFFLRSCAVGDLPDIVRLQDAVIEALPDRDVFARTQECDILESLEDDVCFGIFCGGAPAAYSIMVTGRPGPRNLGTYLGYGPGRLSKCLTYDSFFVLPAYRGYGLQRQLCLAQDKAAAQLGAAEALTTVSPYNRVSLSNLERAGFAFVEERMMYSDLDRLILRKNFRSAAL